MISTQEEIRMLTKIQLLQRELDMCKWDNRELKRDMQKKCEDYESKLNKQKHFIWILICLNSLCLLV